MRSKKSFNNLLFAIINEIVVTIVNFIIRIFFIQILSSEYLGLNSLLTNIITILSITELGISNAIIFNLYKPLANDDTKTIIKYMNFYKNCYRKVAATIFVFGIVSLPFINHIITSSNVEDNIYILYMFFIFEAVLSYLLSYKRSIISADQNNYIISIIHIITQIMMCISQIYILKVLKSYYLFVIIRIIYNVLENIIINVIVNKKYSYVNSNRKAKLTDAEKKELTKNVKGLFISKISWTVINSSDNIIISKICGLATVGIYSNYLLIQNALEQFITQFFLSINASVGNLLAIENRDKNYDIYCKISFISFVLCLISSVCLFNCSSSFIMLLAKDTTYLISFICLFLVSIKFFIQVMRRSICVYRDTLGLFYDDRNCYIVATVINIIFSIVFAIKFGLEGIIAGTIISYLYLHIFCYPKYIYKKAFDMSPQNYVKTFLKYTAVTIVTMFISYYICALLKIDNFILKFIANGFISILICLIIIIILFFKEFKDTLKIILSLIKK